MTGAGLIRANALRLPLADRSTHLVITSPPYFALRSYQDDGGHFDGQIGSEATPTDFLCALWAVMDECWRVLDDGGSAWINLGDKYAGAPGGGHVQKAARPAGQADKLGRLAKGALRYPRDTAFDVRSKSLLGLPWRFVLGLICPDQYRAPYEPAACWHDDGPGPCRTCPPVKYPQWVGRAEVIWNKPNCLSGGTIVYAKVKGRPTAIKVHDLCRAYAPEDVQLWNGTRWTQVVWWRPTGRHADAAESYKAICAARRRGDEPVIAGDIEIELRSGERIGCTREHRWPTHRGLIHAADLAVGDVIDVAPLPEGETTPTALDDEMVGWFVGLYIAEGSRSGTTIQIAGHVNELARYKRLRDLAEAFHGNCAVHHTSGNTATINMTGRFLDAILATYVGGRTAKDKHLRPACWQRSNRFLRAVLDGYLSGDGCYEAKTDRWILGFTNNDVLASDLRILGARVGVSVRLRRTTHTGFGKEWPGWSGTVVMDRMRRRQPDSEVVAIRQSRARQFWDIGVADDPHLFALGSGVLTHNSLPESVTDRPRRSHEQWFMVTKQPRYFAAVDEVRETYSPNKPWGTVRRSTARMDPSRNDRGDRPVSAAGSVMGGVIENPLGKLPGSVRSVPSEPLRVPDHLGVSHFAAFPSEWPRWIIAGWSPSGICTACGEGRRPVVEKEYHELHRQDRKRGFAEVHDDGARGSLGAGKDRSVGEYRTTITGYACACPDDTAPTRPAVVLDPFAGTGTVPMMARVMGRYGVGVDLSRDYLRLARWRVFESGHGEKRLTKVGERPKAKRRAAPVVAVAVDRPRGEDPLPGFEALAL